MDEILASIRRIISEDEAAQQKAGGDVGVAPPQADMTEILELTNALPPEPEAAPASVAAEPVLGRDIGLEALVRSLLAPHLKAWLDAHLPDIVEKMVAAEIARIRQTGSNTPD